MRTGASHSVMFRENAQIVQNARNSCTLPLLEGPFPCVPASHSLAAPELLEKMSQAIIFRDSGTAQGVERIYSKAF